MSRRRRYVEVWDDQNSFHAKRQRRLTHQEVIEQNIEELMTKLPLNHSAIENNLENFIGVLENDLHLYQQKIKEILLRFALQMPDQCTVYTTLVGLLNLKNPSFCNQIIEGIVMNFRTALDYCKWEEANNYLRFLADLVNCGTINIESFMQFLDYIVKNIIKEDSPQIRKDTFIGLVLGCLPWVGKTLYEKKENSLDKLLVHIQLYLEKRKKKFVSLLQVWNDDNPHQQEEYLECLMAQILKLRQEKWIDGHIFRPYLKFQRILAQGFQFKLPMVLPPLHRESFRYPLPRVVFRLFDYTDCPEGPVLPGEHTINRFLIEDHLRTIFERYHLSRQDCARELLNVHYKNKIPLNYCIVEVIFGEMFNLPTRRYLNIAYGSILIELCKKDPTSMPRVLAQATEILFLRLPTMNYETIERFYDWFSYHLSNFNMEWTWSSWTTYLSINLEEPQTKFLQETLQKILRLSYYKKIVDICPVEYSSIIPKEPEANLIIYHQLQPNISEIFLNNLSTDEIIAKFDQQEQVNQSMQIAIIIHHILFVGIKTFTHTFSSFSKYYNLLKLINKTPQDQLLILENIYLFWCNNQQRLLVIINKLLKIQVINCSSVINWIFSNKMKSELCNGYIWEIINATIKHTMNVIEMKRQEYETMERASENDPQLYSQESLQKVQDTIELAEADKKNLLLAVFQYLITLLCKHLNDSEQNGKDFNSLWYRHMIARLKQMLLNYHPDIRQNLSIFEMDLFDDQLDFHILEIYKQFLSLWE